MDKLLRCALYKTPKYPTRNIIGFKKCGKCTVCPYTKVRKFIKTKEVNWKITKNLNCKVRNAIYLVECEKETCRQKYIGETGRTFKQRMDDHIGYDRNGRNYQATRAHFNLPGHSINDMKMSIIEKVKDDPIYRKEREKYHINKFQTHINGMSKKL